MEDKESKLKHKEAKTENNNIFSKENVNMGHQPEFDYLKTLSVFLIIMMHFYEIHKGALYNILIVISYALKAGALMLLMGMGMRYSRHHEPKDYIARGFILLTQSQLVNLIRDAFPNIIAYWATGNKNFIARAMLILQADILSFCGIAFILLGLMKKIRLSDTCILIISIIMNFVAFALFKNQMKSPDNFLLSQLLGYFVLTKGEAYFPLFSYFIFVAFGYWLGGIYQKISNKNKFYNIVLTFCLIPAIAYNYFRVRYSTPWLPDFLSQENYSLVPGPEAIVTCITNLVVLALYYKLDRFLKGNTPEFVRHAGKNLNQYYIISYSITVQTQTFLVAMRGEEFPPKIKYITPFAFLLLIFSRILIDMNDKYIHFTIIYLKNPMRNCVFILIWILTIICVIYIYPKVEIFATMWNDYLFKE